jgi:hypothetical protein
MKSRGSLSAILFATTNLNGMGFISHSSSAEDSPFSGSGIGFREMQPILNDGKLSFLWASECE